MLRLTLINSNTATFSFKKQFADTFSRKKPYKIKKDIWDFGDRLCIGNRTINEVQMWEAIERTCIEFNYMDTLYNIYIDVLSSADEAGYGPCERITTEVLRYDGDNISLEIDGTTETLFISLKTPEAIEEIYGNLEYLLKDQSFSTSKYSWIGSEEKLNRSLYVSRRGNDKKKKDVMAKIPRIALTAAVNNNRKRT